MRSSSILFPKIICSNHLAEAFIRDVNNICFNDEMRGIRIKIITLISGLLKFRKTEQLESKGMFTQWSEDLKIYTVLLNNKNSYLLITETG